MHRQTCDIGIATLSSIVSTFYTQVKGREKLSNDGATKGIVINIVLCTMSSVSMISGKILYSLLMKLRTNIATICA